MRSPRHGNFCDNQKIIGSYLPALDKDGTVARDELRKHFGRSNLLHNIRNKFSYHFPRADEIKQGFEAVPDDDELPREWYLSEANSNSSYFSSEMAVSFGVISQVQGEPNLVSAFRKLSREVIQVANTLQYFLMPFMRAILLKHFGPSILHHKPGTTINDAPGLYDFWIPFFAEAPM